jgi:threonine/homoserine/homoserine lactone efflux protein
LGSAWSTVLIMGTRPIAGVLQRATVVRWLDRLTGGVFLAFGVQLALERR